MRINELEAERRAIEAQLPPGDPHEVLIVHPKTAERYGQRVAEIHKALSKGDEPDAGAILILAVAAVLLEVASRRLAPDKSDPRP